MFRFFRGLSKPPHHRDVSTVLIYRLFNLIFFSLNVIAKGLMFRFNRDIVNVLRERETWITPATYTFGVIGLIDVSLLIFAIYQLLPKTFAPTTETGYKGAFELTTKGIHYYFILAALLDLLWLVSWPARQACISLIVILGLWIVTANIYGRLSCVEEIAEDTAGTGETEALLGTTRTIEPEVGGVAHALIFTPFSLFFAWVTFVSVLNIFSLFFVIDKNDPFRTIPFAIAAIVVLGIISILFLIMERNILFAAIHIWALIGIGQGHAIRAYPGNNAETIRDAALITAGLVFAGVVATFIVKAARVYARWESV